LRKKANRQQSVWFCGAGEKTWRALHAMEATLFSAWICGRKNGRRFGADSVDFVLTDPPYIVRYRGPDGRTVKDDDNDQWLAPAFADIQRALQLA
jgi:hypothetical protein